MALMPPANLNGERTSDVGAQPQNRPVPDSLMKKLHEANARFHEARNRLEQTMAGNEHRHQERVNHAETDFRQAERDVEEAEKEIQEFLGKGSGSL
jgi:exonuclease VII large subunit